MCWGPPQFYYYVYNNKNGGGAALDYNSTNLYEKYSKKE